VTNRIDCDVAITGGAIAGMKLACELIDSGLSVVVIEPNREIPPLRRGDLLAPCTVKSLDSVGALPNLLKRGAVPLRQWRVYGPELETLIHVWITETTPEPFNYCLALPHPLLQAALRETALAGDNIQLLAGMRTTGLLRDGDGMVTGLTAAGAEGEVEVRAKVVCGADGAQSAVRGWLGIETAIETYPYNYLMLTCERSPDQPADQQTEYWGRDGFCGLFPITPDWVRCPVQAFPGEMKRWREIGFAELHREMTTRYPIFEKMVLTEDGVHPYNILKHHAARYVADGALLLGDAVHCTPPYYGMGMTMAMRDAHHAARVVRGLLDAGERPVAGALAAYEAACRPYNEFVITASWQYGQVAASHPKSHAEVEARMAHATALDPDVMGVIYADYDAPPPTLTPTEASTRLKAA
jgi:2-polyprenyl-6-methoxyphenol hydroxylase-like FAD-dependent oxidoreductase